MRDKTTGKIRKKLIIAIIIIVAVVAAGIFGYSRLQAMAAQPGMSSVPDTVALSKTNLESKVTASGNLASEDPVTVGSNVEFGEVETVYAEAGDMVYAGDVLARLKTSDIERNISDASSAISETRENDARSLSQAQRTFDEANTNYSKNLERNKEALESAKKARNAANTARNSAKKTYDLAKATDGTPSETLAALQKAYAEAKQAAEAAQEAVTRAEQQLEDSERNDLNAIYNAKDQLDALQGKDSAKQQRSELESLNEDLSNASITSPITGIVTKVNTENGKAASGDMFTVEDTASLGISASVAEYDVINIEKGMNAYVTSNATDERTYEGVVDYVAPVASDTSGNFEVKVLLTGDIGSLKPGMTATVEIVTAAKNDVFAVPIDAVVTKPDGTNVVYAYENVGGFMMFGGGSTAPADGISATGSESGVPAVAGGSGSVVAGNTPAAVGGGDRREIEVETGMETDYYIEIISDELTNGLLILSDPEGRNVQTGGMSPFMMGGMGGGAVVSAESGADGPPPGGAVSATAAE